MSATGGKQTLPPTVVTVHFPHDDPMAHKHRQHGQHAKCPRKDGSTFRDEYRHDTQWTGHSRHRGNDSPTLPGRGLVADTSVRAEPRVRHETSLCRPANDRNGSKAVMTGLGGNRTLRLERLPLPRLAPPIMDLRMPSPPWHCWSAAIFDEDDL